MNLYHNDVNVKSVVAQPTVECIVTANSWLRFSICNILQIKTSTGYLVTTPQGVICWTQYAYGSNKTVLWRLEGGKPGRQ